MPKYRRRLRGLGPIPGLVLNPPVCLSGCWEWQYLFYEAAQKIRGECIWKGLEWRTLSEFLSLAPLQSGLSLLYPTRHGLPLPAIAFLFLYLCLLYFLHQLFVPHISKIWSKSQVGSLSRLISPTGKGLIFLPAFTTLCWVWLTAHAAQLVFRRGTPCLNALCVLSTTPGTEQAPVYCWFWLIPSYYTLRIILLLFPPCLYSLYFIGREIPH